MKDLKGMRFGKLLVIEETNIIKHNSKTWLCRCDCGNEVIRRSDSLQSKKCKVMSCGCARKIYLVPGNSKLPLGKAGLNVVYHNYKSSAKQRKYKFELSLDEFVEITRKECSYCGAEPTERFYQRKTGGYIGNGIDRFDNELGYVYGNCVPCCGKCNTMKMAMSYEEFITHLQSILNYLNRRKNE